MHQEFLNYQVIHGYLLSLAFQRLLTLVLLIHIIFQVVEALECVFDLLLPLL